MSKFEKIIQRGLLGLGTGDNGEKVLCPERCTCGGSVACTIEIGDAHNVHCDKDMCRSACRGKCDRVKDHEGSHRCAHGHTFPR